MQEIWKNINGYEGMYQVSNLGRVKSLDRVVVNINGIESKHKGRVLKPAVDGTGYFTVSLLGKKTFKVHQLVASAFLNHTPKKYELVVDHINDIKTDNRLENLQLVTQRYNSSKKKRGSSKYTGVHWDNAYHKWISSIRIDGKKTVLGRFNNEYDAHLLYQEKLKSL